MIKSIHWLIFSAQGYNIYDFQSEIVDFRSFRFLLIVFMIFYYKIKVDEGGDNEMKIINFSDLYKYEYTVDIVDFSYYWNTNDTYDCMENGRFANAFLFYSDIESIHTFPNKTYNFKKNDFVYFPAESKSKSIYTKCGEPVEEMNGIDIKFQLFDRDGEAFKLSDDVMVISGLIARNYKNQLFKIAHSLFNDEPPMSVKAKFYELLTDISKNLNYNDDRPPEYKQIINGIKYIEENYSHKISIKDAAKACFMSESHFRKLFTKYLKISPIKYLNELRIKKADELLKSGLFSMAEISEAIGIDNPSYFSWFYKKHTNQMPSHASAKKNKKTSNK